MLDENLPTFFLKAAAEENIKHHESFYFTQHGSEPEATYALRHLDPAANEAKNIYAAALFDSHNPDVLFAEILAKPGWTQPTLSQEDIRKNGGVPPPPQPIFPTEFAIQLYNPDQQIIIRQVTSKWTGSVFYEFSMPQTSFRTPSASSLDRSQTDPGADASTPKINFVWKKEGRLGKDMTCYLTGKSTDHRKRKKSKEPDIAVAMFTGLKELTIYEPHLYRVEMEDYKGLELVLLLGAAAIRDLFFKDPKEAFHILDTYARKNSGGLRGRKTSSPIVPPTITPPVLTPQPPPRVTVSAAKGAAINGLYNQPTRTNAQRQSLPPLYTASSARPSDPRSQWEMDAETARVKARVQAEERERGRLEEQARRRRQKLEEDEARKTRKLLEAEEKERQRRQAVIDKETERLRRKFGDQSKLLPPPASQQRHSLPLLRGPFQAQSHSLPDHSHAPRPAYQARSVGQGPSLQPLNEHGPTASTMSFFSSASTASDRPEGQRLKSGKKSFWGLRNVSEGQGRSSTLRKKGSSMF
ncbi:hypothetical protein GQ43DRAFT_26457 [Delitschia confertaspora ATCC 74209]|uniref:Uncharacterized protein n=1 Tax=Delitschia confertaspora ATCC 74209 TaxID=1513339 RepID=A0A9P4MWR1_9PLEO|nr:hypothetical protein GQ43DRAFT_26457 [Delitschia confertaspora ATCC 74209]